MGSVAYNDEERQQSYTPRPAETTHVARKNGTAKSELALYSAEYSASCR